MKRTLTLLAAALTLSIGATAMADSAYDYAFKTID